MYRYLISVLTLLLVSLVITANVKAVECRQELKTDQGYDFNVHYKDQKWNTWHLQCEPTGNWRTWGVPDQNVPDCARARATDGCSLGKYRPLFTDRDVRIMTASCNVHDACYSTEGYSQAACDLMFFDNLDHARDTFKGHYSSATIAAAVALYGKDAYDGDQEWARKNGCKAEGQLKWSTGNIESWIEKRRAQEGTEGKP